MNKTLPFILFGFGLTLPLTSFTNSKGAVRGGNAGVTNPVELSGAAGMPAVNRASNRDTR